MITPEMIVDWIRAAVPSFTGPVIRTNQNGPRPPGDFISFGVLDSEPAPFDNFTDREPVDPPEPSTPPDPDDPPLPPGEIYDPGDGTGDEVRVRHYRRNRTTVSISVFADDGRAVLRTLSEWSQVFAARLILRAAGASVLSGTIVRDLSGLGDTHFRPRYQSDFIFLEWSHTIETRPRVREITVRGNIRGE